MPGDDVSGHAKAVWLDTVGDLAMGSPTVQVTELIVVRDQNGEVIYDAAVQEDPETGETWTLPRRMARVCGEVLDARAEDLLP